MDTGIHLQPAGAGDTGDEAVSDLLLSGNPSGKGAAGDGEDTAYGGKQRAL